jgi:hypothetical protein
MVTRGKKMPVLTVKGRTGFRNVSGNPILILDERGERFYDTRQLLKRVQMFNLPEGKYYVAQGDIARMGKPIDYELTPMPEKERNLSGDFSNFNLNFVNNPATGTVVPAAKEKFYDHALKDLPLPYSMFIDAHENGHKFYVTEKYCDRYAANKLLERGYNPSQIAEAIIMTLSPDKAARKEEIVRALLNANIEPDHFEKDFPNVQWNTEPLLANPLLFWQDWWNAATWTRWHSKVMEKYGKARANEVFLIWWNKAPLLSPTIDYRTFDKPFIEYAKKNGFYDALFTGIGGVLGKTAGALNKTTEAAGDVVGAAGDIASKAGGLAKFLADNLIIILVVTALLILAITYKRTTS